MWPDPDWGERVHAVVVLQDGATATAPELVTTAAADRPVQGPAHGRFRRCAAADGGGEGVQGGSAAALLAGHLAFGQLTVLSRPVPPQAGGAPSVWPPKPRFWGHTASFRGSGSSEAGGRTGRRSGPPSSLARPRSPPAFTGPLPRSRRCTGAHHRSRPGNRCPGSTRRWRRRWRSARPHRALLGFQASGEQHPGRWHPAAGSRSSPS